MANITDFTNNMTSIASCIRNIAGVAHTNKYSVTSMISTLLNLTAVNDTSGVYEYLTDKYTSMVFPVYAESIGAHAFESMSIKVLSKASGLKYDSHAFDDCNTSVVPANYDSENSGTYNKGAAAPARAENGTGQGITVNPAIRADLLGRNYDTFDDNFYGLASTVRAIANLEDPLTIDDMKATLANLNLGKTQHILARILDRTITDLTLESDMYDFYISRNRLRQCTNLSRLVLTKPAVVQSQSLTGCQPVIQISCADSTTFEWSAFCDDDGVETAKADCTYIGSSAESSCIFSYQVTTGYDSDGNRKTSNIEYKYREGDVIVLHGCNQNGYGGDGQYGTNGTTGYPIASVHFLNTSFIGKDAFRALGMYHWDCNLSYVDLTSIARVDEGAFRGNTNISEIIWPENTIQLNRAVFEVISKISALTIPGNVELLGDGIFYSGGYSTVDWTCNIPSCARTTFCDCSKLVSATITGTPTVLGEGLFSNCASLSKVTIPNTITMIEHDCFQNCSKLVSVNIPPSLSFIGHAAFYDCMKFSSGTTVDLTSVPITSILSYAFAYTSMNKIVLPSTLRWLGSEVFHSCKRLDRYNTTTGSAIVTVSAYCSKKYIYSNNNWVHGYPGIDISHFVFING